VISASEPALVPPPDPLPANTNQGVHTRLQNNIRKPKHRIDGTIAYLASLEHSELVDYKSAM
jgi:hypothetical protein